MRPLVPQLVAVVPSVLTKVPPWERQAVSARPWAARAEPSVEARLSAEQVARPSGQPEERPLAALAAQGEQPAAELSAQQGARLSVVRPWVVLSEEPSVLPSDQVALLGQR